jgi:thymidylate synthase (FAD)
MEPKIYLIGRSQFDEGAFLAFLNEEGLDWRRTPEATPQEELVEVAGRTCYMSFGPAQSSRTNREYLQNLVESGHESVLEHVAWTFLISNISRAFTHQIVRHRVGFAFSQLSQQYHDESEARFVIPPYLEAIPEAREAWDMAIRAAKDAYSTINRRLRQSELDYSDNLDRKELNRAIRSAARSVLPNAIETKLVVTANARALRHLFEVRGSIPGDIEMRLVVSSLLEIVRHEAPGMFYDFEIERLSDGSPIIRKAQPSAIRYSAVPVA